MIVVVLLMDALVVGAKAALPDGAQCVTSGDERLYTGHPWGIAVRNPAGKATSEIRFDNSVHQIVLYDGRLFASGTHGLYCVDPRTEEVRRIVLGDDAITPDRNHKQKREILADGLISWLAIHGQCLWVGYGGYLHRILLQDKTIQIFQGSDLGIDLYINGVNGMSWGAGLALDDGLWVEGYGCVCRLSHEKDSSDVLRCNARSILGVEANAVWCEGYTSVGSRPCRIDRTTGQMTTYYFGGSEDADHVDGKQLCRLIGRSGSGDLVFSQGEGNNAILRNGSLEKMKDALPVAPFKFKRFRSEAGAVCMIADMNSPDASFVSDSDVAEVSSGRDSPAAEKNGKAYELLSLKGLPSPSVLWEADPRMRLAVTGDDVMRLGWIDDANPYLRWRVIAHLERLDYAILGKALNDPFPNVREAALHRLVNDKSPVATALLRVALDNDHPPVRCYATLGLLRRGELPATKHVRFTASEVDYLYIDTGRENKGRAEILDFAERDFWTALAPVADVEAIAVMQERPQGRPMIDGYFKVLGERLAKNPNGILRLTDGTKLQEDMSPAFAQSGFAQNVAVEAGRPMLPIMHQWLSDSDFRRRAFAASVCGKIGDKSSLDPLIKALEHDDGLALGAVVEALGRLKLAPALQPLTELYLKVDRDIGDRLAFSGASMPVWCRDPAQGETNILGEQSHLFKDAPKGCMPATPRGIADAIEMIGPEPEAVQSFFRQLYHKPLSVLSRDAVAGCLRPEKDPGNAENMRILSELIKDVWAGKPSLTAFNAAVSLLHFGCRDGDAVIIHQLSKAEFSYYTLGKLERLQTVSHDKRAHLDARLNELLETERGGLAKKLLNELLKP